MTNKTKLTLTLFILTVLTYFPWTERLGIEIRWYALAMVTDSLFFIFLISFLVTVYYLTIKNFNGTWHLLILFSFPFIFLYTCVLGLAARPVYWQDNRTFKNRSGDNEFLIYQTFGSGFIGGDIKGRFIVTRHKDNKVFRPIHIKSDSSIPKEISDRCLFAIDSIPKSILLDNDTYDLIDSQD
jgi:hypothetical protein